MSCAISQRDEKIQTHPARLLELLLAHAVPRRLAERLGPAEDLRALVARGADPRAGAAQVEDVAEGEARDDVVAEHERVDELADALAEGGRGDAGRCEGVGVDATTRRKAGRVGRELSVRVGPKHRQESSDAGAERMADREELWTDELCQGCGDAP